jgi:hypothetical protein
MAASLPRPWTPTPSENATVKIVSTSDLGSTECLIWRFKVDDADLDFYE